MSRIVFYFGFLIFLMGGVVIHAQEPVSDVTGPVSVNIDLTTPVISITLGASPDVNFIYQTAEDYTDSKTESKSSHFTVISNLPYDISVKAESEFTSPANNNPELDLVEIQVDPATPNGGDLNVVPLSLTGSVLVEGADPSAGAVYNVDYSIPDATPLLGLDGEVYSTTVTYTATHL